MEISYNGVTVTSQKPPYKEIDLAQTQKQPTIKITQFPKKYSSLIMYDPDSVKGIFIHWLVINIPNNNNTNINNGNALKPYYPPSPPIGTGKHRYIFKLYRHDMPLKIGMEIVNSYASVSEKLSQGAILEKTLAFLSENKGGDTKVGGRRRKSIKRKVGRKKMRKTRKY